MDVRKHLHDGEVLLYATRSSVAHLLWLWLRSLPLALVLIAVGIVGLALLNGGVPAAWSVLAVSLFGLALPLWLQWRVWAQGLLRITTDRIVIDMPEGWWHPHTRTIKWGQYQESETGKGHLLGTLFGAKSLHIRFGSADSHDHVRFPYVYMASDLKHYLDKIDRQVRMRDFSQIRAFVPKKKGKRY